MTKTIAQRELRNDNAGIIAAVVAGESFVVTRNGVPVAEIGPYRPTRRTFVGKQAMAAIFGVGPHVDADSFRGDLDGVVDPSL